MTTRCFYEFLIIKHFALGQLASFFFYYIFAVIINTTVNILIQNNFCVLGYLPKWKYWVSVYEHPKTQFILPNCFYLREFNNGIKLRSTAFIALCLSWKERESELTFFSIVGWCNMILIICRRFGIHYYFCIHYAYYSSSLLLYTW